MVTVPLNATFPSKYHFISVRFLSLLSNSTKGFFITGIWTYTYDIEQGKFNSSNTFCIFNIVIFEIAFLKKRYILQ